MRPPGAASGSTVSARAVERRFPGGRGAGPIDLDAEPGETLALMGPNGAGKTTLLRLLATVDRPDAGTLTWFGGAPRAAARRSLGLALDAPNDDPALTARQAAHFWCRQWVRDRAVAERLAGACLDRYGLGPVRHDAVGTFSYGMRRRLALVEALAHEPRLALLDEPTAGLDPEGAAALRDDLDRRAAAGLTSIVASNDAAFVERVATRVGLLVAGRLVRCEPPQALLAAVRGATRVEITTASPPDLSRLAAVAGVTAAHPAPGGAVAHVEGAGVLPGLVAAVEPSGLRDLRVRPPDLADAFRTITGEALASARPQ